MSERAVGTPIDRVDGRLKVTGAARYAADAPVSGVLHGFIVGSVIGRGRVRAIDADDLVARRIRRDEQELALPITERKDAAVID